MVIKVKALSYPTKHLFLTFSHFRQFYGTPALLNGFAGVNEGKGITFEFNSQWKLGLWNSWEFAISFALFLPFQRVNLKICFYFGHLELFPYMIASNWVQIGPAVNMLWRLPENWYFAATSRNLSWSFFKFSMYSTTCWKKTHPFEVSILHTVYSR